MTTETITYDWTVLDNPVVFDAIRKAAHRVARVSAAQLHLDLDDLVQEGSLLAAENAEQVHGWAGNGDIGLLVTWLWRRLLDKTKTEIQRAGRNTSYERATEVWETWQ
ncbi:hypothetical protein ACIA8K_12475 [Catenuloplanes sp. NPDC051500]|uniref:hypothetical protein n=1 Tax=Catenuloplanes sp. NPDC051500 TaxID=3363959 RepID=UPI0037ABBC7B